MADGEVTFTVKELVSRVDAKVDAVLMGLQGKAERSAVDALEKRVTDVETKQIVADAKAGSRWRWLGLVVPTVVAVAAIVASFLP